LREVIKADLRRHRRTRQHQRDIENSREQILKLAHFAYLVLAVLVRN
jgi:hypothetical protein